MHIYCMNIYCTFVFSYSPVHELSSPLQPPQQGTCPASTCQYWWSRLPKITRQIPLLTQCGVSQGTRREKVSTQNLSTAAAGLAPAAVIAPESTSEEQFSTARRITKLRTSPRCQKHLTEGCNRCLWLLPTSRLCNLLLLGYLAPSPWASWLQGCFVVPL